jgi:hypothetical protein
MISFCIYLRLQYSAVGRGSANANLTVHGDNLSSGSIRLRMRLADCWRFAVMSIQKPE